MKSKDDGIKTLAGLAFLVTMIYLARTRLAPKMDIGQFIVICVIAVFAVLWLCQLAIDMVKAYRRRFAICPHGLRIGARIQKCDICNLTHIETKRRAEERRLEMERLAEERRVEMERRTDLARRAKELAEEEESRLFKLRLRRLDTLLSLSPSDFEDIVAGMYRSLGYAVRQTPYVGDGGKDAIATKDGKCYAIECKRYGPDKLVGRPHLQRFLAAMMDENADRGIFVTTSDFADTAVHYGRKNNMELINGKHLCELMGKAFPEDSDSNTLRVMCRSCAEVLTFNLSEGAASKTCECGSVVETTYQGEMQFRIDQIAEVPKCNRCGRPMRLVAGRNGKFWGCTGYPICRSTQRYAGRT